MKAFATTTELMPHQQAAVDKIKPIRVGALFMQMGTGKSRTAIELVKQRIHKIDHAVWFCPVSLKKTVLSEIKRHTDCESVYLFDNKTNAEKIPKADWYVVGIESMSSSDRAVFAANQIITDKTFVILDESAYIKGPHSRRTERITLLCKDAKYRLALTGTPISQGVVDLFAQMRFLSPKILGYTSFYSFAANHLEYSEKFPGMIVRAHNTEFLAAKMKPYVYQVTKRECLSLPRKMYETRHFGMTDIQRGHYEQAKDELLFELESEEFDSTTIFRLFGTLQQIVSGYWNYRVKWERGEPKPDPEFIMYKFKHERADKLLEVIKEVPDDEKIIIWCKYVYDIEQITKVLEQKFGEEAYAVYFGGKSEKQRHEELQKFKSSARFFVATPSCGGHGLTINEAHYVIFYNNSFKYAERIQSEDRCHRIGQINNVTYIDIICSDSIDERIDDNISKKGQVLRDFKKKIDEVKNDKVKLRELIKAL